MTFVEDASPVEETLGPGTDLVISLFSTFLLLGIVGAALANAPAPAAAPKDGEKQVLPEGVIALDSVKDGFQHFKRQSADLDVVAVPAIVAKLRPLQTAFDEGRGQLIVHVIGHASPEPFGLDDGDANFRLALQRAMTVATLAHRELNVPYECLRVHGYGRGESESLRLWLGEARENSLDGWDERYREKREREKSSWPGGPTEWQGAYALGQTELGRELAGERRVVLKTERATNDLCARAFAERPPVPPARANGPPSVTLMPKGSRPPSTSFSMVVPSVTAPLLKLDGIGDNGESSTATRPEPEGSDRSSDGASKPSEVVGF